MITYDMVCAVNSFICEQDGKTSVVINQDSLKISKYTSFT